MNTNYLNRAYNFLTGGSQRRSQASGLNELSNPLLDPNNLSGQDKMANLLRIFEDENPEFYKFANANKLGNWEPDFLNLAYFKLTEKEMEWLHLRNFQKIDRIILRGCTISNKAIPNLVEMCNQSNRIKSLYIITTGIPLKDANKLVKDLPKAGFKESILIQCAGEVLQEGCPIGQPQNERYRVNYV
jgi:hypothetical protein